MTRFLNQRGRNGSNKCGGGGDTTQSGPLDAPSASTRPCEVRVSAQRKRQSAPPESSAQRRPARSSEVHHRRRDSR